MKNAVNLVAAAPAAAALQHFELKFQFQTDCWDVHEAIASGKPGFVLIDARSHELYARGHLPTAVSLPHRKITEAALRAYPAGTLFVTYCAGPHCNGANKGALRLAELGLPVKEMIGGVTGWLDEGFALATGEAVAA